MKGRHVLGGSELELKPYCSDQGKTPQVIVIKYFASTEQTNLSKDVRIRRKIRD